MKIGKLKKIDVRELWTGQATDFTPWLAKDENIKQLGDVVQIELEVIDQEKNVGPFRADILCKNTIDDHYVLIENQLEKSRPYSFRTNNDLCCWIGCCYCNLDSKGIHRRTSSYN